MGTNAPIVREFVDFGKQLILAMLNESPEGFIEKKLAYDTVVDAWLKKHGQWHAELTRMEKARGKEQPVYINRLWWMPAELAQTKPNVPAKTEPATKRPFIALKGCLDKALTAYGLKSGSDAEVESTEMRTERTPPDPKPAVSGYTPDSIRADGCFLELSEIESLHARLLAKKNLILQGPPGTGKTWLAKRLAFALIGQKDDSKVRAVQFHPNLSYEDFVLGWRPADDGKLSLTDGIFMRVIASAIKDPASRFVVVIEEINRGNPAQIFGELPTLLEASKRSPSNALELCYSDNKGTRSAYIPENLYVIGTMNIADRSLALVDLALRRRFAFAGLEPRLGPDWRDWVVKRCNVDPSLVADIERRINTLNDQIAADARLGKQSRIGHSFVTPTHRLDTGDTHHWFRQVVETEIGPLLEEYWFDAPDEAVNAQKRLLQDW